MADKKVGKYRGIDLYDHPTIRIRVSQFEFKKFVDARLDQNLSAREVLEILVQPCETCHALDIFFDRNDNEVKIKRGILSKKR